jgi:thioredoxin 2
MAAQQFEPFVRCAKFNAEGHMDIVKKLNIQQIPTLALYLSGKEIAHTKGSMPLPQLEQWLVAQLRPALSAG